MHQLSLTLLSCCGGMQATADKNAAVAQADKTSAKAALAQRLIANLAGENQRWTLGIGSFAAAEGAGMITALPAPPRLADHGVAS